MMNCLNISSIPLVKKSAGLVIALALVTPTVVAADEAAMALLNRMNEALHQLTYKGTLAYLRGNELSTLMIDHRLANGVESERVVRLNEEGGEVSRELKGFSLASIPKIRPEMEKVYSFDMGRQNRIANIPCVIITARPKDRERYLQKFCIDMATGMLLDYMLVGKSHKPVEQFMFTTIEIRLPEDAPIREQACLNQQSCPDQQLETVVNAMETATAIVDQAVTARQNAKTRIVSPSSTKSLSQISPNADLDDGWVMEALPVGYEIRQAPHLKGEKEVEGVTKHYVVSDGLSSLSVFVSPLTEDTPTEAVKINSGALNVVSQRKAGHFITVVGEVPESTLKNIVNNLRKK